MDASISEVITGDKAYSFLVSKGFKKDYIDGEYEPIVVKVKYKFYNVNVIEKADVDIYLKPSDVILSDNTIVIGGTGYFTDGLGENISNSDKSSLDTGDTATYEGYIIYPVLKNSKHNYIKYQSSLGCPEMYIKIN